MENYQSQNGQTKFILSSLVWHLNALDVGTFAVLILRKD